MTLAPSNSDIADETLQHNLNMAEVEIKRQTKETFQQKFNEKICKLFISQIEFLNR
jgi:Asp-tRNA(Asn)/Glu-tRNA(Gln) amidotransferase C subunit